MVRLVRCNVSTNCFLDSTLWKLMTKMQILDSTRGVGDVSEDPGAGEECRLKAAEESELTE